MARKIVFGLLLVIFLIAIYFYFQFYSSPTGQNVRLNKPDILLITIDTIRPDYLSCYGGSNRTPNLDTIARGGILFENVFSQVPLTFPSHTSILSGLFPSQHGMHNNGMEVLSKSEYLITHQLKKHGYQTGAVVASFVLDRKFGLHKDFDFYEDRIERSPGITTNFEVERPGNEVNAAAFRILEKFGESPWFLWLHYYDPHTPYAPPKPYNGYAGEVQFVDDQIGKVLGWLKSKNKAQNTIVAVIGDHGESLGEHGEAAHGFFAYNSTLKIPFLLTYPGAPRNKRITETTATVDLVPTLMQLGGLSDSITRDGESLLPVLNGKKRTRDIYFESKYPELLGWNGLQGVIRQEWKLIATTRSELYDWRSDPNETQNLFSQKQSFSEKLKAEVSNHYAHSPQQDTSVPDSETVEKLKSLGYVSTTTIVRNKTNADPKDKIAVWSQYEKASQLELEGKNTESLRLLEKIANDEPKNNFFVVALASRYRKEKKLQDALKQLQIAVQNDPADENAYQNLALTYKDLRNYSEALKAQQASVALNPNRSEAQGLLGMLLVETGHFEEARLQFVKVLQIDPNNAVAWNNYGNALRETHRLEEAKNAYEESIRLSPHYAYPLNGLATILIRQNHISEAITYLEKAIELDPAFVEVYLNLGIAYHTLDQTDKARTLYKTFLKVSPDWMKQERENAQILLSQIS